MFEIQSPAVIQSPRRQSWCDINDRLGDIQVKHISADCGAQSRGSASEAATSNVTQIPERRNDGD